MSFMLLGQLVGAAEPARSAIDEVRHLLDLGNPQLGLGLMALAFVLFAACYRSLHSEPQEQNKFRAWHAMAVGATVLLLIAAWIDAAGVFPRFAFVFLGILLSWLAMEAKDTWRRYSVQPNHFVVIGAVLALLVTIVGMFYTRIKNFDAGETNRFFPVDFAVAAFIAVVTPTAVLLRTLHAAKSWQQEIIDALKYRALATTAERKVEIESQCAKYKTLEVYVEEPSIKTLFGSGKANHDEALIRIDRCKDLQITLKLDPDALTPLLGFDCPHTSKDVLEFLFAKKRELPCSDRLAIEVLHSPPPLSALFFGDASGNTETAVLISHHDEDQGEGEWLFIGDAKRAGHLRNSYRATYPAVMCIEIKTGKKWEINFLKDFLEDAYKSFQDKWQDMSERRQWTLDNKVKIAQELRRCVKP